MKRDEIILFHILKSKLFLIYILSFEGTKCSGCKQGFGFNGFRCIEKRFRYLSLVYCSYCNAI